jgi:hypothetical protein
MHLEVDKSEFLKNL